MPQTALQNPKTMAVPPTHPQGPALVHHMDAWGGPAAISLADASRDPRRAVLRARFREEALKAGLSESQAQLFAHHKSSAFATLEPSVVEKNGVRMVNGLVPEDSWRQMTDRIISVAQKQQTFIPRAVARGLTSPIDNLGIFIVTWHSMSDLEDAQVSMDGRARQYDEGELTLKGSPVPIIHKDFEFGFRQIMAAANAGAPLDTAHGVQAGLKVGQKEEDIAMNGASVQWGGFSIEGLTNATGRLTEATANDFGTPANVETKILALTDLLRTNNHNGPYEAWVSTTQFNEMQKIFDSSGGIETSLQMALRKEGIEQIHPSQFLTDEIVIVEMSPIVIELAVAEDIRTIQWEAPGGLTTVMRVFSAKALKIHDATGIAHGTGI